MGSYWHSLLSLELRQSEAVLPRRSTLIIGGTATLIISGTATVIIGGTATVITDETEMIAIAETIDMMIGMGITTRTKSPNNKVTGKGYRLAQLMPSVAKATIRNDHTSGKTVLTATTRVTETRVSTSKFFATHLSKATMKVTSVTVGATAAVTTDDGETAVYGPGK